MPRVDIAAGETLRLVRDVVDSEGNTVDLANVAGAWIEVKGASYSATIDLDSGSIVFTVPAAVTATWQYAPGYKLWVSYPDGSPVERDVIEEGVIYIGSGTPASSGNSAPARIVADVVEGGLATSPLGWRQHSADAGWSLSLAANTRTQLPLAVTQSVNRMVAALDMHNFFSGGLFRPHSEGDSYRIRISVAAASSTVNNALRFELDIGGTQGVIDTDAAPLVQDAGSDERAVAKLDFFVLGTFIANGGAIYVEANAAVELSGLNVLVKAERQP